MWQIRPDKVAYATGAACMDKHLSHFSESEALTTSAAPFHSTRAGYKLFAHQAQLGWEAQVSFSNLLASPSIIRAGIRAPQSYS